MNLTLIMVSALTEMRLNSSSPDLILRPELPNDLDLLLSFDRSTIPIIVGEEAANKALPDILNLFQAE